MSHSHAMKVLCKQEINIVTYKLPVSTMVEIVSNDKEYIHILQLALRGGRIVYLLYTCHVALENLRT